MPLRLLPCRSHTWNLHTHLPAPLQGLTLSVCFQPTSQFSAYMPLPGGAKAVLDLPGVTPGTLSVSRMPPTLHQYSFSLSLAQESVIHEREAQVCPHHCHFASIGLGMEPAFVGSISKEGSWHLAGPHQHGVPARGHACLLPSDLHPSGVSRHRSPDQAPGSAHGHADDSRRTGAR